MNVETDSFYVGLSASHPFMRSREASIWFEGGLDYVNSDVDALGAGLIQERLWVGWVGATGEFRDQWSGANRAQLRVRQGLDIFDGSNSDNDQVSRPGYDGDFTSVRVDLARLQRINDWSRFFVGGAFQYSFDETLASEEFVLGGLQYGRGYDPAELSEDSGFAATAEMQLFPGWGLEYVENYHFYGFFDFGHVWDSGNSLSSGDSLVSTGVGLRMAVTDWLQIDSEVAQPINRDRSAGGARSPQFYLTVTARF